MSTCVRCGAPFSCAMADADPGSAAGTPAPPCWCTLLPPAVPLPTAADVGCWCPDCVRRHIADLPQGPGQDPDQGLTN